MTPPKGPPATPTVPAPGAEDGTGLSGLALAAAGLWGFFGLFSLAPTALAVQALAQPGALASVRAWAALLAISTVPASCIAAILGALGARRRLRLALVQGDVAQARHAGRRVLRYAALPIPSLLLIAGWMILLWLSR